MPEGGTTLKPGSRTKYFAARVFAIVFAYFRFSRFTMRNLSEVSASSDATISPALGENRSNWALRQQSRARTRVSRGATPLVAYFGFKMAYCGFIDRFGFRRKYLCSTLLTVRTKLDLVVSRGAWSLYIWPMLPKIKKNKRLKMAPPWSQNKWDLTHFYPFYSGFLGIISKSRFRWNFDLYGATLSLEAAQKISRSVFSQ